MLQSPGWLSKIQMKTIRMNTVAGFVCVCVCETILGLQTHLYLSFSVVVHVGGFSVHVSACSTMFSPLSLYHQRSLIFLCHKGFMKTYS